MRDSCPRKIQSRGEIRDIDSATGSTRMMRAPMSANNIASSGSGPIPPSSTRVMPASGPDPGARSSAATAPLPFDAQPATGRSAGDGAMMTG